MNYWQNYPKFMVSLLKACYGKAATKENDFGYDWLPKIDGNYSWMYIFDDMYRGSSTRAGGKEPGPEGLITFGMNPVGIGPNSPKMIAALSKLKWLVVVENHEIETATFWKAPKEYGGADRRRRSRPRSSCFRRPTSPRRTARFTNSARWIQWKWKALDPPGQAKIGPGDPRAHLPRRARALPQGRRRRFPRRFSTSPGPTRTRRHPTWRKCLKEMNGKALADLHDPKDKTKILKTAGQQLDGFGQLQDDGSTMCGNWLMSGVYTEAGNMTQRRNPVDDPIGPRACTTTGPSPGRPTGASCTTGPPPTPRASPGIRRASGSSGTARSGSATSRT